MERLTQKLLLICCTTVLLAACNDNGSDDGNQAGAALQQFSNNNGESKEIMAPAALQQDLTQVFGANDAEPVAVNATDNVQVVIDRANGQ